jgi:predicted PurR-regulated permease PerM
MIEQTLEGKVIAPKLLGNSLKVHPVTVVVILLSAGNIFGLAGVVFGIPGYAIAKVLIYRLYKWWQLNSGLFRDETNQ